MPIFDPRHFGEATDDYVMEDGQLREVYKEMPEIHIFGWLKTWGSHIQRAEWDGKRLSLVIEPPGGSEVEGLSTVVTQDIREGLATVTLHPVGWEANYSEDSG